jgi:hypothetical protein
MMACVPMLPSVDGRIVVHPLVPGDKQHGRVKALGWEQVLGDKVRRTGTRGSCRSVALLQPFATCQKQPWHVCFFNFQLEVEQVMQVRIHHRYDRHVCAVGRARSGGSSRK